MRIAFYKYIPSCADPVSHHLITLDIGLLTSVPLDFLDLRLSTIGLLDLSTLKPLYFPAQMRIAFYKYIPSCADPVSHHLIPGWHSLRSFTLG
ncbi:hypothetical protein [Labilibaculum antarcticum]|nr:hypothetical protein [Labilibaculum antarcticum]